MAKAMEFRITHDGIMEWFEGPEWDEVVEEVFKGFETTIETAARANAPWGDDTGNARAGLTATVTNVDGLVTLSLAHTVEYGFWLEVIQSGRFAILERTITEFAPQVFREVIPAVKNARQGSL